MKERDVSNQSLDGLEYASESSWEEVKAMWKANEDTDDFRREYKEQGYESWELWREKIIAPLHLDNLTWRRFSIANPSVTVPKFRGGPFKPWEELYYGGKETPTFAEIVETKGTDVTYRDKFNEIIYASKSTILIGLELADDVYIVEGMHRSTSIALAVKRGYIWRSPVEIFLATSDQMHLDTIA
jgi:hypothetical protein